MSIGFAEPAHLYLLIPLCGLITAGVLFKRSLSRRFDSFFHQGTAFTSNLSSRRAWTKQAFLALSFCMMVIAFAAPFTTTEVRSYNFMALVDISQSMWCQDYREQASRLSRLEIAKRNLLSLVKALPPESRFGLAAFAGSEGANLILTPPRSVGKSRVDLESMIRAIRYSWIWNDGTSIAKSISSITETVEKNPPEYGSGVTLIVLTDGEETKGLDPREPSREPRRSEGVRYYFAGHGTPEGAPVPELDEKWQFKRFRTDPGGAPLISKLDEQYLKGLAKSLNGSYGRIQTGSDLKALANGDKFKTGKYEGNIDISWILWLASFGLLVLFLLV